MFRELPQRKEREKRKKSENKAKRERKEKLPRKKFLSLYKKTYLIQPITKGKCIHSSYIK